MFGRELIQFCFRNETSIKRAIWESKLDNATPKCPGHGSGISKPTEIQAMKNLQPIYSVTVLGETIYYPEKWVRLISMTKAKFNHTVQGVIYHTEFQLNLAWRERKKKREEIMRKLNLERSRYYELRSGIVDYAENLKEEMGIKE